VPLLNSLRAAMPTRSAIGRVAFPRVLYGVLVAAAAAYVAAFVIAALFRLTFPFPLEITESAALEQLRRIQDGQPLYVEPTLQHVPLIYGPAYFYVSALLAVVTGSSYLPLRLVSLLASLGSLVLVGDIVRRETGKWTAGLIAAGLFAATYPLGQTAFDLGRVDALFLAIVLASLYLAYFEVQQQRPRQLVLALSGALMGLAALTKAPIAGLPIAGALFVYLLLMRPRSVIAFVLGLCACLGIGILLLQLQSGTWATWFLWDLPRMHALRDNLLGRYWFSDVLPRFSLPLLLGPVFLIGRALQGNWRPAVFWGLVWTALIGVAWASRSNNGASTNVLLPAFAVVALAFGLGLSELLQIIAGASPRAMALRSYLIALCLVQFALLAYNPRLTVPYRSDEWADAEFAARLASLPGPLFAPNLEGYVDPQSGEQPYFIAVGDLDASYGGTPTREGLRWWSDLQLALQQRQFASVVLRDEDCCALRAAVLDAGYVDKGPLFSADDQFWLLKTMHTPDAHLYSAQ
jgi:hypothetical protein